VNTGSTLGLLAVVLLCLATSLAIAHHSFPAEFDRDEQGELTGEIVKVWFRNPHVRYRLKVRGDDGTVEVWDLQSQSITNLRRQDWGPDTIQVGETVKVWGDLGRNQSRKLFVRGFEKEDGSKLYPNGSLNAPNDRNKVTASPDKNYGYAQVNPQHPFDISGPWRNNYKFRLTVDDLEPKPTPFTAEGKRVFDSTKQWQDAVLRCMPLGLPRVIGSPYPMDIVDAGSHYQVFHVQNNTMRRIWMDGRVAADDQPITTTGFSTGNWEDDVLIIRSTHLTAGTLDGSLLPMSGSGTRTVEHWEFSDDRLSMDRVMTIYDAYYAEPLVRRRGSARDDIVEINEQAPCDPDAYYLDLLESGHIDEKLDR
jgi:hypothetical protein